MELTDDPASPNPTSRIDFNEAEFVRCAWHGDSEDSDAEYLCTLLGIDERHLKNGAEYLIATDSTEVFVRTTKAPELVRLSR